MVENILEDLELFGFDCGPWTSSFVLLAVVILTFLRIRIGIIPIGEWAFGISGIARTFEAFTHGQVTLDSRVPLIEFGDPTGVLHMAHERMLFAIDIPVVRELNLASLRDGELANVANYTVWMEEPLPNFGGELVHFDGVFAPLTFGTKEPIKVSFAVVLITLRIAG